MAANAWTFLAGVASPPTQGAGVPAPGTESNREDLIDVMINLDKNKTAAVLLAAPKTDANGMNHEWLTEQLDATSTAGFAEGEDWGSATSTPSARTRLANAVQTFKRDFSVSNDQIEYSVRGRTPGVSHEYEHQVGNKLVVLGQSVDARIVANGTSVASASASASNATALMAGIRGFQVTASSTAIQSGVSNAWGLHVGGAWNRAKLLSLHENMFTAGANPDTLAVDPGVKSDITIDVLGETAAATAAAASGFMSQNQVIRQVHFDNSPTEFTQDIQYMRTDYGRIAILVDRFIPQSSTSATNALAGGAAFLYERARLRVAFWRPMRHYPLQPNGESVRGYVHTGVTLEPLHPRTIGVLYNITT